MEHFPRRSTVPMRRVDFYNKIKSILPNDEVKYISDCEVFFEENNIDTSLFKSNQFILLEETMENWINTLDILDKNDIKHSIHIDKNDSYYIVVSVLLHNLEITFL